jgi:hypothetical protein
MRGEAKAHAQLCLSNNKKPQYLAKWENSSTPISRKIKCQKNVEERKVSITSIG